MKLLVMTCLLPAALVVLPVISEAQKPPLKFGEVAETELNMKDYETEPGAPAVVLCDFNVTEIEYVAGNFVVKYDRFRRVKIFSKEGYDMATFKIPLYKNNEENLKESVLSLKGFTYNLENGKIVKSKLDKASIFIEKISDKKDEMKFTMPDVKEGSIIEFSYTKNSDFLAEIDTWSFQESVPVTWSELFFKVPEYFNYLHISGGYEKYAAIDNSSEQRTVTFVSSERDYYGGNPSSYSSGNVIYKVSVDHFLAKDMPSLKEENFVGNLNDYRQKIEFQLATTKFGNEVKDFMGTWESINKKLTEDADHFGPNMAKKGFYKDAVDSLKSKYPDPKDRAFGINTFVSNKMKWNNMYNYIPDENIKKAYEDGTGSSADINALLISMLRAADIDAEPVILSTRSNGQIHPIYPLLSKYNDLIAAVWIGEDIILLDATDNRLPPGVLPEDCLNGKGRCISEKRDTWINLDPVENYSISTVGNIAFRNDKLNGVLTNKKTGYAALESKANYESDGEAKYIEAVKKDNPGWNILKYSFEKNPGKALQFNEKYEFETDENIINSGENIYFDPVISSAFDDNPFKNESRKFPVDFGEPVKRQYIITISLPSGYTVEEIPKSLQYLMPDKSASFKYIAQQNDSTIQVLTSLVINKGIYLPDEYKDLREFFGMVIQKNKEQIVLKKLNQ
jgi:transglutaminase-like putative cysteine protease